MTTFNEYISSCKGDSTLVLSLIKVCCAMILSKCTDVIGEAECLIRFEPFGDGDAGGERIEDGDGNDVNERTFKHLLTMVCEIV